MSEPAEIELTVVGTAEHSEDGMGHGGYSGDEDAEDGPSISYGGGCIPGPPHVKNILGCELCERFAYYGLRAILVLYLAGQLNVPDNDAVAIFSYTSAVAYFSPLLGGYLSDVHLGKYRTILYFAMIYIVGVSVLAFTSLGEGSLAGCLTGLCILCMATGGLKACISPFGGDQFRASDEAVIRQYFSAFYASINLGSVVSYLLTPILREHVSFFAAFGVPAVMLSLATFIFWLARKKYHNVPPQGSLLARIMRVFYLVFCFRCCGRSIYGITPARVRAARERAKIKNAERAVERRRRAVATGNDGKSGASSGGATASAAQSASGVETADQIIPMHGLDRVAFVKRNMRRHAPVLGSTGTVLDIACADPSVSGEDVFNAKGLLRLLPIFAVFPVFWMLFDQQGSSWTLQATEMDTHFLQPEQLGVMNPISVLVLIPLVDKVVYPFVEWMGIRVTHLRRIGAGMVLGAIAFMVSSLVNAKIEREGVGNVSIFWQVPQIVIISLGEVCISVTGLEFAFSQAPLSLKGTLMSMFLVGNGIGDLLLGVVYNSLNFLSRTEIFMMFGILMMVNFIIFLLVSAFYTRVPFAELQHVADMQKQGILLFDEDRVVGRDGNDIDIHNVDLDGTYVDDKAGDEKGADASSTVRNRNSKAVGYGFDEEDYSYYDESDDMEPPMSPSASLPQDHAGLPTDESEQVMAASDVEHSVDEDMLYDRTRAGSTFGVNQHSFQAL